MTNACNGCAECIGCGRKDEHYTESFCDECGFEMDISMLRMINGKAICWDCYEEQARTTWDDAERIEVDD